MKELTFTISEVNCGGFVIGEKTYNIKCKANAEYNYRISQRELFNIMETLTERFNNMGIAVLFEID